MSSEAALLQEIQRLSGAIDRHKLHETKPPYAPRFHQNRTAYVNPAGVNKKYVNPAIANKKYVNPAIASKPGPPHSAASSSSEPLPTGATRELVIDGIAFETSNRKLTRKDLISSKPESSGSSSMAKYPAARARGPYIRKGGNLVPSSRVHKPKYSKGKRPAGRNNMVLDNIKGTRTGQMSKRRKMDKQCRFFTMTGVCQRGLTCPYQHDPEKIAICPLFLTHACPNNANTCQLSHDPNPSRVPLCHHFANHGRCTRDDCPYPHVRVGPRHGVCRDFAVAGYCDKGIDCDKQHVRECPDFAEKGVCPNKGCKLPHVIRANKRRQPAQTQVQTSVVISGISRQQPTTIVKEEYASSSSSALPSVVPSAVPSAVPAELGAAEEYISLTFEESDDDDDEDEDDDDDNEEDGEGEDEDEDAQGTTGELVTSDINTQ